MKTQSKITQLACMAHARRKFEHAKDNDPQRSAWAMSMIQRLYDIERKGREASLPPGQVKELRQKLAKPILNEMGIWLKEQINLTLPKSAIGGAIAYTLTLWPRLIRYIEDGRFQIDNNLIENSIRPVALGRKNYLFAGDPKSYFHRYAAFDESEARQVAEGLWNRINLVNLRENILPTRPRAHLILGKATDHRIEQVALRRV
jgi:hypothetical protein